MARNLGYIVPWGSMNQRPPRLLSLEQLLYIWYPPKLTTMKKLALPLLALALTGLAFTLVPKTPAGTSIEIGTTAPLASTKMTDVSGKSLSLNDIKKENGVLVVFSCNTCPFVVGGNGLGEGWETRYNQVKAYCDRAKVGMVLVNSNEAKRDGDDSMQAMKKHAREKGYQSYYVVDKDSKLADAFGAKTTPHVFLFDGDMKLVYKGAIDDNNTSAKEVKEYWLQNALMKLSVGEQIEPSTTRNKGCSIKRVK